MKYRKYSWRLCYVGYLPFSSENVPQCPIFTRKTDETETYYKIYEISKSWSPLIKNWVVDFM